MEHRTRSVSTAAVVAGVAAASALAVYAYLTARNRAEAIRASAVILEAARQGDAATLRVMSKRFSAQEVDSFRASDSGNTAIHLAASSGNVKAVEALVNSGVDVLALNNQGVNCMHTAAIHGHGDTVAFLCSLDEAIVKKLVTDKLAENGWQVVHIVSVYGYTAVLNVLLERCRAVDLVAQDLQGNTPLILASWNGHANTVESLLNHGAPLTYTNTAGKSALYTACRNGRDEAVRVLLEWASKRDGDDLRAALCQMDRSGYSPLHSGCMSGNTTIVRLLVQHGATPDATARDGSTALHMCARKNKTDCASVLLTAGADVEVYTNFGASPLHEACTNASVEMVQLLLGHKQAAALVASQDYDGLFPLHSLCNACFDENADPENVLKVAEALLTVGSADPNSRDYSDATPLFYLCWKPARPVVVSLAQLLLEAGADASLEADQGWGPLHVLVNEESTGLAGQMLHLVKTNLETVHPNYLAEFCKTKPRDTSNANFHRRRGPHNRIPIESRLAVFNGEFTLEAVAAKILSGQAKKIIVMSGAGMSANAGLPDYRSSTGLYTRRGYSNAFDYARFLENPAEFYDCVEKVFLPVIDKQVAPTKTHFFVRLLQDKGLLLRHYTQNVDMLERAAGVRGELLVESHGSLSSATCVNVQCGYVAHKGEEMEAVVWSKLRAHAGVPQCPKCSSVMKPNIVFFGESLPPRFHELLKPDCDQCDLLIVIGTSLVVYPFASIANSVPLLTPRLLLNKEAVGPFRDLKYPDSYRDIAYLGDCDEGVMTVAKTLGWEPELTRLYEHGPVPTNYAAAAAAGTGAARANGNESGGGKRGKR